MSAVWFLDTTYNWIWEDALTTEDEYSPYGRLIDTGPSTFFLSLVCFLGRARRWTSGSRVRSEATRRWKGTLQQTMIEWGPIRTACRQLPRLPRRCYLDPETAVPLTDSWCRDGRQLVFAGSDSLVLLREGQLIGGCLAQRPRARRTILATALGAYGNCSAIWNLCIAFSFSDFCPALRLGLTCCKKSIRVAYLYVPI